MKSLLYILMLIILTSSCNPTQLGYEKKTYWPNGNIKKLGHFDSKDQVFLVEGYDSLGNINSKINWSNNKRNGKAYFYYPSGKIKEESYYVNDSAEGKYIEYYENGRIKSTGYYKGNKGIGNAENYNEQGRLTGVYQTYLTKTTSLFGEFDSNGKVLSEYPFVRIRMKDTIKNGDKAIIYIKIYNRTMLDSVSVQFNPSIGIAKTTVANSQDSIAFTLPKYDIGRNVITGEFKSRIKDDNYDTSIVYINLKIYQPFFVKEK